MVRDRKNRLETIGPPPTARPRLDEPSRRKLRQAITKATNTRRSETSSYLERLAEHAFIAEIMREGLDVRAQHVEVLRAEVDSNGYDLVMEANKAVRYIQLKYL